MPLWTKDAAAAADDWMMRFTVGDDYRWDRLLLPYDVRATRAHAWGLGQIGVLSETEIERIGDALDALLTAFDAGDVTVTPADEDAHTVIERFLTDRLGDVGRKIHTGRSRNDQVLAALRLFLQDALADIGQRTAALARALCTVAEAHPRQLLPGYTHLQRAMPSTVAVWALGFAETLAADLDLLQQVRTHVNVSPLGSAAGYGVPHLDLPRRAVADRLGFRSLQTHVTAPQLTRGKHEVAVVHACVQIGHIGNRLASDLVLYASAEFDFMALAPEHCTGSSIMPQKQNPDVMELTRAHYHRLVSEMTTLATGPANLPSGYHRDLQLTKAAVMRSLRITRDMLTALERVVSGLTVNTERAEAACTPEMLATHRALKHVTDGVPFRTAYQQTATSDGAPDAAPALDPDAILDAYVTAGGPGHPRPDRVRAMLDAHANWIAADT